MNIKRQMGKGAAWMVLLRSVNRTVGLISTLILVRLLSPADFGLVAMATVVLQLLASVSELSVDTPLIQRSEIDRDDLDSAWSLEIVIGILQGAVVAASAPLIADFFGDARLAPIIYAISGIALVKKCKNIGIVMFQREMTFDKEFLLMAAQRLVSFTVTITIAVIWRTYWALVAGMFANSLTTLVLSYVMHPYRPKWSTKRWGAIVRFSRWLLLNNILDFLRHRLPDIVIGRLISASAVGIFSISYEIASLPQTELVAPINRAALPGYSRLQASPSQLNSTYLDVTALVALVAAPVTLGLAAISAPLVAVVLGSKWTAAAPLIHWVALAIAVGAIFTNIGPILVAVGKPHLLSSILTIRSVMFIPLVVIAAMRFGLTGVAASYLIVSLIMFPPVIFVVLRQLSLPFHRFAAALFRPLIASVSMYVTLVYFIAPLLSRSMPADEPLQLLALVAIGAAIYTSAVFLLWASAGLPQGAERTILRYASEFASRPLRRLLRVAD